MKRLGLAVAFVAFLAFCVGGFVMARRGNVDRLINRGFDAMNRKEFEQSLVFFNAAVKADPKNSRAYSGRGQLYLYNDRLDFAIKDLNTAIALDPRNQYAYIARSRANLYSGDIEAAIADGDMAVEISPNEWEAYEVRAEANLKDGNFDSAIRDAKKAVDVSGASRASAEALLASCYAEQIKDRSAP